MRTDLRKCSAHNLVHGLRETCPRCAEARRAEVLAKAGEKPAPKPWASAWENVPPYPVGKYEPRPLGTEYTDFVKAALESMYSPRRNFITEVNQDEGRITMSSLTEAEARAKGFPWGDRPEAYEYRDAPKTPAGRWAAFEEFAAAGFFGPAAEPEPFSPETFCPPGREALERAGYECLTEARGGGLAARHPDGNAFYGEVPAERLSGDQAERFLTFAWETMALDAGLDGILAMIEDGDDDY